MNDHIQSFYFHAIYIEIIIKSMNLKAFYIQKKLVNIWSVKITVTAMAFLMICHKLNFANYLKNKK